MTTKATKQTAAVTTIDQLKAAIPRPINRAVSMVTPF